MANRMDQLIVHDREQTKRIPDRRSTSSIGQTEQTLSRMKRVENGVDRRTTLVELAQRESPPLPSRPPTAQSLAPFLRWVGGKQKILHELQNCLPGDVASRYYREPFAGAAALFFALAPGSGTLSDINAHLIDCYENVRKTPGIVSRHLDQHARSTSESHYYKVRKEYNSRGPS